MHKLQKFINKLCRQIRVFFIHLHIKLCGQNSSSGVFDRVVGDRVWMYIDCVSPTCLTSKSHCFKI